MTDTTANQGHTPGPWMVGTRLDGDNTIKVGVPINEDKTLHTVAYIAPRPSYEKGNPQLSNARLIAAAPELLEACRAMLSPFEDEEESILLADALDLLKAAIAKAEGK